MPGKRYWQIAVSGPMRRTFTYHAADDVDLMPGQRVAVPFGPRPRVGFVVGPIEPDNTIVTKRIRDILDPVPILSDELTRLCLWIADYYFANPADVFAAALPTEFRKTRALHYHWAGNPPSEALPNSSIEIGQVVNPDDLSTLRQRGTLATGLDEKWLEPVWPGRPMSPTVTHYRLADDTAFATYCESRRQPPPPFTGSATRDQLRDLGWTDYQVRTARSAGVLIAEEIPETGAPLAFIDADERISGQVLTPDQQAVVDTVRPALDQRNESFLLHGVTGSGKTRVYAELARHTVDSGQGVLMLTPEIALTGSLVSAFRGVLGEAVTVLHSAMTERERLASWVGLQSGRFRVAVGPRSALLAPVPDLGLVIVDEEHDPSYKQDDPAPRFQARDAAIMRAKLADAPIVLGSASPSLETYHAAQQDRHRLLSLPKRATNVPLPTVRIVDLRSEGVVGEHSWLSLPLKQAIDQRINDGDQVILFLNRRGYAGRMICTDCGAIPGCPHCHLPLTYHKVGRRLTCHWCGHTESPPEVCPDCKSTSWQATGTGTQRIEELVPQIYPMASVARFDADTARGRARAWQLLQEFAAGKQQMLLGTQMVTKGLDLPNVTLVGVLNGDQGLDLPDFRASEKTFARLVQVAGRAGRGTKRGEVIIQTWDSGADVINLAAAQDYTGFYDHEIGDRSDRSFPPYVRLVAAILSGTDEAKVADAALALRESLLRQLRSVSIDAEVLGPAPAPIYRLRGKFRRRILVKTRQVTRLTAMLTEWEGTTPRFGVPSSFGITIDVDPDDMM